MLRHNYDRLEVTGDLTAVFDPKAKDGLEKAVEYFTSLHQPLTTPSSEADATTPQTRRGARIMVWLMAVTKVKVGNYRWPVNSLLTYEQVAGKTDEEIWKLFDHYTDKHIEAVVRSKVSYPLH